jgi:serine/threonine protein phosphatase PrpC
VNETGENGMISRRLEVASVTDPGVVRSFNEDSIATDDELGLFILADGMGGYKAGDVASCIGTGLILKQLQRDLPKLGSNTEPPDIGRVNGYSPQALAIRNAIENANGEIFRTAQADSKYQGMGTTVVVLLIHSGRATVAHVGDSRLYRLRHGRLELLTHDHSLLQEQVELGLITADAAKSSHNRNLVTRALGVAESVRVDIHEETAVPGDIYLLCSDGLNDMVDDADIELALTELQSNLPLAANQLVLMANDNGGHDNISVIVTKIGDGEEWARPGLLGRLFGWMRT